MLNGMSSAKKRCFTLIELLVVIAIIVVAHTVSNNSRYRGKVYSYDNDPPSYTPPSSSSDGTWHDGKPWTADHANAKDM